MEMNIISGLDHNKDYGNDMISISMLQICDESVHKPYEYSSSFIK